MSRTWRVSIALVAVASSILVPAPTRAQDSRPRTVDACRERLEVLDKEYVVACAEWLRRLESDRQPTSKPTSATPSPASFFLPRYVSVADDFAGTVGETRALIRAMLLVPWNHQDKDGRVARLLDRLAAAPADEPELAALCDHLHLCAPSLGDSKVIAFLERIRLRTALDVVRAATTFHLATLGIEYKSPTAVERDRLMGLIAELQRRHPQSPYAKAIEPYLFELENLQPGMKAPFLEGPDRTGKIFSLAELEGRPTVLVFGDPTGAPTAALLPTLEELAGREGDRKINVVLVTTAPNVEDEPGSSLPGRNMIDRTPDQKLFASWNAFSTPMVYVLDKHGVIRHRHLRDRALVSAVDRLKDAP